CHRLDPIDLGGAGLENSRARVVVRGCAGSVSEAEHALGAPDVGRGDVGGAVQATLAPRGLVLEQVATVGLLAADLAAAGDLEALARARMALRLRCHGVLSPYIGWLPPRGAHAPRGWSRRAVTDRWKQISPASRRRCRHAAPDAVPHPAVR